MAGTHPEDIGELLALLESPDLNAVREIKDLISDNLSQSKDTWLLNGLVDFYLHSRSQQCLNILAKVNETHGKHLLDRLLERLRGNKLAVLTAVGYLVRSQPPWLHTVVHHGLMMAILKCLKTETDVPILLTGLLALTAILPLVPVSISSHLQDIFDIFAQMAAFNLKKPGNVPDVYLLHLQIGTYSLFHRLYGMYPCHFLTYLRSVYGRRENLPVFNHTIKPMLDTVRMHPLLVTSTKEREIAPDRWRQMEVQDIIVDCSKLALDPIEGTCEQVHCPITAMHTKEGSPVNHGTGPSIGYHETAVKPSHVSSMPSLPEDTGILTRLLSSEIWSPAGKCGLVTPPPPTPGADSTQLNRVTPISTPVFPHLGAPQDETKTLPPTTTPTSELGKRRKRLSGFSLSLAGKITTPTETNMVMTDSTSVPPSPLKPFFTSDPPFSAQPLQAIRNLSFQEHGNKSPNVLNTSAVNVGGPVQKVTEADPTNKQPQDHQHFTPTPSPTVSSRTTTTPLTTEHSGLGLSTEVTSAVPMTTPPIKTVGVATESSGQENGAMSVSLSQLPTLISDLAAHSQESRMLEDIDHEVVQITGREDMNTSLSSGSDDIDAYPHFPNDASLTAESVAAFRKKVKRIRFNTVGTVDTPPLGSNPASRPRSCPDFTAIPVSSHHRDRAATDARMLEKSSGRSVKQVEFSVAVVTSVDVMSPLSQVSMTSAACQTNFSLVRGGKMAVCACASEESALDEETCFPYDHLFPLALPFAPMIQCFDCVMREVGLHEVNEKRRDGALEPPLFTCYSPADLLDRHLERGGEVHARQLNHLPLPCKGAVSWTHFGGLPPADEVAILRGQNMLLHNQLMFERNRRELHAMRNRRLLGRIVKTTALEEHNAAMKEQEVLHEKEIENLSAALNQQQTLTQQLRADKDSYQCERQLLQRRHQEEMSELLKENLSQETQLQEAAKAIDTLSKDLQQCKLQVFNLTQELAVMKSKMEACVLVKSKLDLCERELLLMGELQEKYKQRLVEVSRGHQTRPAVNMMLTACRAEVAALSQKLDHSHIQLEVNRAKVHDLEDQVKVKDSQLGEQEAMIQQLKLTHQCQLKALEDKYSSQQQISAALEAHVLNLYHQVELLSPHPQRTDGQTNDHTDGQDAANTDVRIPPGIDGLTTEQMECSGQVGLPLSPIDVSTGQVSTTEDSETEVAVDATNDWDDVS